MKSINLQDLMSEEDVRRFGAACYRPFALLISKSKAIFKDNYAFKRYKEYVITQLQDFLKGIPALSYLADEYIFKDIDSLEVEFSVSENKLLLKRKGIDLSVKILIYYRSLFKDFKALQDFKFIYDNEIPETKFYEEILKYLQKAFDEIINQINKNKNRIGNIESMGIVNSSYLEGYKKNLELLHKHKKALKYLVKNFYNIIASFSNIEDKVFLEYVDFDKLELSFAIGACSILANENNFVDGDRKSAVNFLEKYLKLIKYLENRAGKTYYLELKGNNERKDFETFLNLYTELRKVKEDVFTKFATDISIDDVLKQELVDARRKIRREDIENNLQVGWEILPNGNRDNKQIVVKTPDKSRQENKTDNNARDLELLEEKKAFYPNTDYLYCLNGREAYEGYSGFVYKNGLVVLDKFFNKRKDGLVPTHTEGFVVMHILDLIEMSKYTKTELMDLIREGKNKSAQRKYHTSNWQERVQAIIDKPVVDYDFEEINEIIEDVLLKATNQDNNLKK